MCHKCSDEGPGYKFLLTPSEYQKYLKGDRAIPADMDFETAPILVGHGLTKREYFAGLAMQSIFTSYNFSNFDHIADRSIKMADALIKELDKEK